MFKQAVKNKSKLRLLIGSPSGGGKTLSSLLIASGISDKICVVDTERGSASLYADKVKFDVAEMEKYSVDEFIKMIIEAERAGYDVFIADSTTHIWDEILEDNQKLIKAKPTLNSYTVWMDGNSKYKKFIQAILTSKMHIICTVRMKTEYVLQDNGKGRTVPTKVGMGMEQRSGFEYEFTAVMEGTVDNVFTVTKDRTGLLQGQVYEKPGVELGKQLKDWLNSGAEPMPAAKPIDEKPTTTEKPVTKPKEPEVKGVEQLKSILSNAPFGVKNPDHINNFIEDKSITDEIADLLIKNNELAPVWSEYLIARMRTAIIEKINGNVEWLMKYDNVQIDNMDQAKTFFKTIPDGLKEESSDLLF